MRHTIALPQIGHSCVTSAVSTLRAALKYKTSMPAGLEVPKTTTIDWIIDHSFEFFRDHRVESYRFSRYFQRAYDFAPVNEMMKQGNKLFIFDYYTSDRVLLNLISKNGLGVQSHTVIGLPDHHEGTYGMFVIAVTIK